MVINLQDLNASSNITTVFFSSRTSGKLWIYRIAVLAKTSDFIVSHSARQTISAMPLLLTLYTNKPLGYE